MGFTAAEADAIVRGGVAAMQRRDPAAARAAFARLTADDAGVPAPWLLLAQACLMAGDRPATEAALDRLLADQPAHVRGLIMKGDCRVQAGDLRGGTAFYAFAVKAAAGAGDMPPALRADVARAEAAVAEHGRSYEGHLEARLAAAGLTGDRLPPLTREAIAIATGRAQVQLQQPTSFYVPGLPQRAFYERGEFDWVAGIEAAFPAIRDELAAVLAEDGAFPPYVEPEADRPAKRHSLLRDPSWGAFHLWRGGAPVAGNADRCPRTVAAVQQAPVPRVAGRSPMLLFSLLKPGTHIQPHTGMLNSRLICHLPLVVPPGCRFRVGNETRTWEEGRLLIFDDSIEHEAWNDGRDTRVILLFEVWRPELDAAERAALTTLYEAIGTYGE